MDTSPCPKQSRANGYLCPCARLVEEIAIACEALATRLRITSKTDLEPFAAAIRVLNIDCFRSAGDLPVCFGRAIDLTDLMIVAMRFNPSIEPLVALRISFVRHSRSTCPGVLFHECGRGPCVATLANDALQLLASRNDSLKIGERRLTELALSVTIAQAS
jgi:hypothetical protein